MIVSLFSPSAPLFSRLGFPFDWSVQLMPTVNGFLSQQVHGKHCGVHTGLFPFAPIAFFPCPTWSCCHQGFCSYWHLPSGQTHLPVPAISLTAFSLKQDYNNLLKIFISRHMKTSKATPVNKVGLFPFSNGSLYFDTRCLTAHFSVFYIVEEKLPESWSY